MVSYETVRGFELNDPLKSQVCLPALVRAIDTTNLEMRHENERCIFDAERGTVQ